MDQEEQPRGRGRPPLDVKRVALSFALDPEQVQWVADLAHELGVSRSVALRYALDKWCRPKWPPAAKNACV